MDTSHSSSQSTPFLKRRLVQVFLTLALVLLGYGLYAFVYFYHYAERRTSNDMMFLWQWKLNAMGMRQAYMEDTYGGSTPEETLALYITALKEKNPLLASRYYIPEYQAKEGESLSQHIYNPNFNAYVEFIEGFAKEGKVASTSISGTYMIAYKSPNLEASSVMEFYRNPQTGLWKIVRP